MMNINSKVLEDYEDLIEDKIQKIAEKMQTKEDFEHFLVWLMEDLKQNKGCWENKNLESYLDGLYGSVISLSGYYKNIGDNIDPDKPSWRMVAELLLAARVYE